MAGRRIFEQSREIEVRGEYDVIVVGGGPAGIAAAVAAAGTGARTLLVERYGFLGGMATAGMVGSFCGFFTTGREKKAIIGGLANTMVNRLRDLGAASEKSISRVDPRIASIRFDPEIFKLVAERLLVESGVEPLFHTLAVETIWKKEQQRLAGIAVENKSGRSALLAKVIVDATGDADIAFRSGVPFEFGDGQGRAQALTTIFRMINVDEEKIRDLTVPVVKKLLEKALESGDFGFKRIDGIINPALPKGMVSANIVSVPDLIAIDAWQLTRAEMEGRRQVMEYIRAFRSYLPGFERAQLSSFAPQIGVRETRRVLGLYRLSEEDVITGRKFDDAIALGAWPVEIHDPVAGKVHWKFLEIEDDYYTIPLRSLLPEKVENLIVAGRCISTTHGAQASTRVIGPSFATGEAAGVLAALSADSGLDPKKVSVEKVQNVLKKRNAILDA